MKYKIGDKIRITNWDGYEELYDLFLKNLGFLKISESKYDEDDDVAYKFENDPEDEWWIFVDDFSERLPDYLKKPKHFKL